MNPILHALRNLGGEVNNLFSPQQKLISPVPQTESPGGINDPTQMGLNYYYQREVAKEPQPNQSQFVYQPKTIQYPAFLANTKQVSPQQVVSPENSQNAVGQALQMLNPKPQQAYAESYPKGASDYEKQASDIFDKQGVPPAIGLGIWAMEGRGQTINPNNPYNIGAYDTNPDNANAYQFKDPLEGTREAAKFLAGQSDYQTADVQKVFKTALQQYKKDHDQVRYLQTIAPVYSTNPQYVQTITQTPEFQRWSYNN